MKLVKIQQLDGKDARFELESENLKDTEMLTELVSNIGKAVRGEQRGLLFVPRVEYGKDSDRDVVSVTIETA